MLEALEHQDAGAFAEYRAVALLCEREAAFRRQHVQRLPGFHRSVRNDGLGSAGNRDIDNAVADIITRNADGVGRCRTRRTGRERRTFDAELDADVSRRRRADDAQQRQRVRGALLEDEEIAVGRFKCDETAGSGTDDAGRPIRVLERHLEAGHANRFVGCSGCKP